MRLRLGKAMIVAAALLAAAPAHAGEDQTPVDRSDPSVVTEDLSRPEAGQRPSQRQPLISPGRGAEVMTSLQPFVAGAIRVEGAAALPASAYAGAIEPFLGRALGQEELRALATSVASVARNAGYGLATAWIPPQSVTNGVLRVRVDEGRVDAVEVSGPGREAVERRLSVLIGERPVLTRELERQLLIVGDAYGVSAGRARLVRRAGRNILTISTAFERVSGRVFVDNWGSETIGPVKARLVVDINGIIGSDDRLSIGGVLTPLQPSEFQLVHAGYAVPVGSSGTELSLNGYLSHSRPGGVLRGRDFEGTSAEIEAGVSHPIVRSRAFSVWGSLHLGVRDSNLSRADMPVREDRIVTATASAFASGRMGRGHGRTRIAIVQGLGILDATRRGDPLSSRSDASSHFTKFTLWSRHTQPLGSGFSVELGAEGQLSTRPLLASEEMGLGGRAFIRGFDYRELAGDKGGAASAELRFDLARLPRPVRRVQLYAYADLGHVANLGDGLGGGTLASAGGGVRVRLTNRLDGSLELGIPLTHGAFDLPRDPRLSFTLNGRF